MSATASDSASIAARIRAEVDRALQRGIKGLEYMSSGGPALGVTPRDLINQRGTLALYHHQPMTDEIYRVPLLLVMAVTNRGYIPDLALGQSLVEYPLKAGYDVFVIDWNAPPEMIFRSFDMLDRPAASPATCSGSTTCGTTSSSRATACSTAVPATSCRCRASSSARPRKSSCGRTSSTRTRSCWAADQSIWARSRCRFHAVAEHDHIVPYDAARPLAAMVGSKDKEEVVLKGGHVSVVAGANAVKRLWPRLDAWLGKRST